MYSSQLVYLIVPSDNTDTPAVPDHVPEDLHSNESAEPNTAANEKKPGWRPTASATAKLVLRGVRDAADAFGPLKSVLHPRKLRGMALVPHSPPVRFTGVLANEGKHTRGRVIGTSGQDSCRIALRAGPQG